MNASHTSVAITKRKSLLTFLFLIAIFLIQVMFVGIDKFKQILDKATHVLILTGSGISAESDIPTFRGAGGLWRKYQSQSLATPEAFKKNPSLVWEFYHYRRELVLSKKPNKAHYAMAEFEKRLRSENRILSLITQNVDGLHEAAGSECILELHGSLFRTRCTKCGYINENRDSPICPALAGKGAPNIETTERIPDCDLPRCKKIDCGGLLRPDVVWFGENLNSEILLNASSILNRCDACLVVGTSSIIFPAAGYVPQLLRRKVPVAEFNIESTPHSSQVNFKFDGPCSVNLPLVLSMESSDKTNK